MSDNPHQQSVAGEDTPAAIPMEPPASSALSISFSTAIVLLLFTLIFTALMATVYNLTLPDIKRSQEITRLNLIRQVLPSSYYDNDLLADVISIPAQSELGTMAPSNIWRARLQGKPAALVIEATAPDGYSGNIELLLAVSAAGQLMAVRVTEHRETPGLGDYIDPKKDRNKKSPWIAQFNNLDYQKLPTKNWRLKFDGGKFDARAGATISARAVSNAVAKAYAWVLDNRANLFSKKEQQP